MIGRSEVNDAESFDRAWTSRSTGSARPRGAAAGDIAALLQTAELLTRSASIEPSAQFTADLRARLMAEAADVLVAAPARPATDHAVAPHPHPRRSPRRRRLAGLTAALVAGTATVGMVASSASAVPGDVLYPVKRGVESVQLAVHRDDAGRGQTQLDQANERLREAWTLDSTGRDDRVADALDAFTAQAEAGSTALFDSYGADSDDARIDAVNTFAAGASGTLVKMSDDLPTDAQAALDTATQTVLGLAERAGTLCTSCAGVDLDDLAAAGDEATDRASGSSDGSADDSSADDASTGDAPGSAQTQQPARTTAPQTTPPPSSSTRPAPSPSVTTPGLRQITEPVVGGLLGDDEQPGLVPSLVDGLLGGGKKK